MKPEVIRFILGAFLNLEIWFMAFCNIVCLLCIYRGRLHLQKENPVFVVPSLNMLVETLQLFIHLVYVGPAIFIGSWFFDGQDSLGVTITATGFLWLWFLCSLNQILMAFNRLSVVCFPTLKFSKSNFLYAFLIMLFVAAGMITYSGFISPCCRLTPDPIYFGYSYLVVSNTTENLSMKYVDFPIDLFFYILQMKTRTHGQGAVKTREIRLCVQFVIVYLTYNLTWGSFFLFPMLGISYAEAYMTTTVVFMANCGTNAIILQLLNKEVQREFYLLFRMKERLDAIVAPSFTGTQPTRRF